MLFDQGFHLWFISSVGDVEALGPVRIEDGQAATHLDVFIGNQGIILPAHLMGEVGVRVEKGLHVITNQVVGRIVYLRTRLDVQSVFTLPDFFHEARNSTRVQHTPALAKGIASGPAFSSSLEWRATGAQYHLLEKRCPEPQAKG